MEALRKFYIENRVLLGKVKKRLDLIKGNVKFKLIIQKLK